MPPIWCRETIRKILKKREAKRDVFHSLQSLDRGGQLRACRADTASHFGADSRSSQRQRQRVAISDQERPEIADPVGQLSRRPPCRRGARRGVGRRLLSLSAAHRSEEQ